MADDDQEQSGPGQDDPKGSRDNTEHDHTPDTARHYANAPPGSLGTNSLPGLSLGGSTRSKWKTQVGEQAGQGSPEISQEPVQAEPVKDERPIAVKTGDADVDRQSEADGYQLKTMDEIRDMAHGKPEAQDSGPRISQSAYAAAFRRARDGIQRERDQEIG